MDCQNLPQLPLCVPLSGHCCSVMDSLLPVPVLPLLGFLTVTHRAVSGAVDLWGNWLRVIGGHPMFYMSQAVRREQVCRSSNKGCCISHLHFAINKPDPFSYSAHLRPHHSCRLFYKLDIQSFPSQSSNDNNVAAHPLITKNLGMFCLNGFDVFESLNFVWEIGRHWLPPRLSGYPKGSGLYIPKRSFDVKRPPFWKINAARLGATDRNQGFWVGRK